MQQISSTWGTFPRDCGCYLPLLALVGKVALTCKNADFSLLAVAYCPWSRPDLLRTICGLAVSAAAIIVRAKHHPGAMLSPPSRWGAGFGGGQPDVGPIAGHRR